MDKNKFYKIIIVISVPAVFFLFAKYLDILQYDNFWFLIIIGAFTPVFGLKLAEHYFPEGNEKKSVLKTSFITILILLLFILAFFGWLSYLLSSTLKGVFG